MLYCRTGTCCCCPTSMHAAPGPLLWSVCQVKTLAPTCVLRPLSDCRQPLGDAVPGRLCFVLQELVDLVPVHLRAQGSDTQHPSGWPTTSCHLNHCPMNFTTLHDGTAPALLLNSCTITGAGCRRADLPEAQDVPDGLCVGVKLRAHRLHLCAVRLPVAHHLKRTDAVPSAHAEP